MQNISCTLNIRYDLPQETLDKLLIVYQKMPGWMGTETSGINQGIPFWFSFNTEEKHILASIEPSGLQFDAKMDENEWKEWKAQFLDIATQVLGFNVVDPED